MLPSVGTAMQTIFGSELHRIILELEQQQMLHFFFFFSFFLFSKSTVLLTEILPTYRYLNSNHLGYDNASQAWSTLLADPAPRHGIPLARQPAPMFPAATPRLKGDVPVLAMSKIGNFNPAGAIEYPAQVITAIRDVFYQLVWAKTPSWLPLVAELTSDARLDSAFEDVGVNPATWASRAARAQAVSQAQDYVILSQAMLVNWVMVPETAWQKLVAKINDDMNIGWDGKIWPFGESFSFSFSFSFFFFCILRPLVVTSSIH